jgi:ABC-type uncharacterized transport system involved in gliding motility auxiliary subunit
MEDNRNHGTKQLPREIHKKKPGSTNATKSPTKNRIKTKTKNEQPSHTTVQKLEN